MRLFLAAKAPKQEQRSSRACASQVGRLRFDFSSEQCKDWKNDIGGLSSPRARRDWIGARKSFVRSVASDFPCDRIHCESNPARAKERRAPAEVARCLSLFKVQTDCININAAKQHLPPVC